MKFNLNSAKVCCVNIFKAFTLVEMLMALLIVSVILSASLPVISQRQKAMASSYNQNRNFPIGGVILWTDMNKLPDNTWMECNGTAIPNGVEYEQARRIFGANIPDLRNTFAYSSNLNNYLKTDLKNYLQTSFSSVLPKNLIAIWGTSDTIPRGWSWDQTYNGVFIRGLGTINYAQNNGDLYGVTNTAYSSASTVGGIQGDTMREISGIGSVLNWEESIGEWNGVFYPAYNSGLLGVPPFTDLRIRHQLIGFNSKRQTPLGNEIRPINKAVKFIKYTNPSAIPELPEPPSAATNYRFIAKVRY